MSKTSKLPCKKLFLTVLSPKIIDQSNLLGQIISDWTLVLMTIPHGFCHLFIPIKGLNNG